MRLLSVFTQCFLIGALLMAHAQPIGDGSIQTKNKAVAMRVFDEIFNQGKFQVVDEIYAPDFQNHGLHQSVDLKTDQEAVHAEKKAFPDLQISVGGSLSTSTSSISRVIALSFRLQHCANE